MDHAARMRIVEIEAVYQQSVEQHGVAQCEALAMREYGRLTADQRPVRASRRACHLRVVERRRGEREADAVQDQMFRAFPDGLRDIGQLQVRGEARERARDALSS